MKLGKLLESQQKYDMALAEFKEVVKNEPGYFSGNPRLGEPYRYVNIIEIVLREHQRKLRDNPRNKEALKVIGKIHLSLGRLGQAEEYYQQLVQLSPNDYVAAETLRKIRRKMRKL
jgi:tetratricopeptide (TPR) repeat protein